MEGWLSVHVLVRFDLFGLQVPVARWVVVQWAAMAIAFLGVWLVRRSLSPVPGTLQNLYEIALKTLGRWAARIRGRRTSGRGGRTVRPPEPETAAAFVWTAGLLVATFWVSAAIVTLPVRGGPMARLVEFLTPIVAALRERTILGPILERFGGADIGEEISKSIAMREAFGFDLFGFHVAVADVVVVMWLVMAVLFLLAFWLGRDFHPVPKGKQLIAENLVNGIQSICGTVMEKEVVDKHVPFIGSIGLFIILSNVSSVFRLPPPAKNPAFPIALALTSIGAVLFFSIREVGFRGFARSMLYPKALMLPFKIIDFGIKIISLSLRLFGNIFGAFILMEFVNIVAPILLPGLIGLWFDLADGVIQGVVFGYLTALYIGEVVENAHHAA